MVTPNARRNRGQVILIGAITLAFILLGIVVVFNGVLYTETVSESSTSQSTADAEVVGQSLEQDLVEIANQTNWSDGEFKSNITSSGGFIDQYRNVTANSRSVFVNVSSPETEELAEYGYIDNGSVYPPKEIKTNTSEIEYLVLNLSPANDDEKITINATTEDGNSSNVTINADDGSFTVNGCTINSNEAKFNLVTGEVDGVSSVPCNPQSDLSIIDNSKEYYNISFKGDDIGSYHIVAKNDFGDAVYDVWKINIEISYRANEILYIQTAETVVIGGDSE